MTRAVEPSLLGRPGLASLAALLAFGAAAAAGCGGDDDTIAEFTGRWYSMNDPTKITCPSPGPAIDPFPIWDVMLFEPGVVSDLAESASSCPLAWNVNAKNKVATPTPEDPYLMAAPQCAFTASTGSKLLITPTVDPALSFNLLKPEKGKLPRAQIIGKADVVFRPADILTGTLGPPVPCTPLDVSVDLYKYSNH